LQAARVIRQLEIQDDEDDEVLSPSSQGTDHEADDNDDHLKYTVSWESTRQQKKASLDKAEEHLEPHCPQVVRLKERGNQSFRGGQWAAALRSYQEAVDGLESATISASKGDTLQTIESSRRDMLAQLYSNISATLLKLGNHSEAVTAALHAHTLHPSWLKPLHRLAEAYRAAGRFAAATSACRRGEALCEANSEGRTEFSPLMDRIAVEAAICGNYIAGFDGRVLEVRSAGKDAWLGRPAPHVPELDGPLDEDSALPSDDIDTVTASDGAVADETQSHGSQRLLRDGRQPHSTANDFGKPNSNMLPPASIKRPAVVQARADAMATWSYADSLAAVRRHRTSFRCIKEAMAAARDGDHLVLKKGVHNGMGESVIVNKRVLIEGEGSLGESVIDQRANVPMFRITHGGGGAVLRNIDLDQTGFREAVLVTGKAQVAPLIDGCIVKCSGDDAVNVAGEARPLFRGCQLTGKKCGVRAFDRAFPRLEGCMMEKCGEQGMKLAHNARVKASQCRILSCEEDGVVVMDSAAARLTQCEIAGAKGPGVDVSDSGRVIMQGGHVHGCVGGLWVWDQGGVDVRGAVIDGGPSQVLLADGQGSSIRAKGCVIKGTVHAGDGVWGELLTGSNSFEDPEGATDFPPEEGPFRFVPSRFTRL
jgi:tetratricopeptide (TPR) repeat protein